MRCPKCGYISFDHLEECSKCKKQISGVTGELHGTVRHIAAPVFLRMSGAGESAEAKDSAARGHQDGLDAAISMDAGNAMDEMDFLKGDFEDDGLVDNDLAPLLGDGGISPKEDELLVGFNAEEDGEGGEDFAFPELDDEDREIEMDLSQFKIPAEEAPAALSDSSEDEDWLQEVASLQLESEEGERPAGQTAEEKRFSLPDELADISDLAPPRSESPAAELDLDLELEIDDDELLSTELALEPEVKPAPSEPLSAVSSGIRSSGELSMDDLDIDLDLGVFDSGSSLSTSGKDDTEFNLNDLDFSDDLGSSKASGKSGGAAADMDEELNFDLDLGGLSIHKDV